MNVHGWALKRNTTRSVCFCIVWCMWGRRALRPYTPILCLLLFGALVCMVQNLFVFELPLMKNPPFSGLHYWAIFVFRASVVVDGGAHTGTALQPHHPACQGKPHFYHSCWRPAGPGGARDEAAATLAGLCARRLPCIAAFLNPGCVPVRLEC